jgi:hypothetical protein
MSVVGDNDNTFEQEDHQVQIQPAYVEESR